VAISTRIRLDQETSSLLVEMLREYLAVEWDVRAQLKRDGQSPTLLNRRIATTKRLLGEVQRAREEAGWLTPQMTSSSSNTGSPASQTA
jgi:hypothetical protein